MSASRLEPGAGDGQPAPETGARHCPRGPGRRAQAPRGCWRWRSFLICRGRLAIPEDVVEEARFRLSLRAVHQAGPIHPDYARIVALQYLDRSYPSRRLGNHALFQDIRAILGSCDDFKSQILMTVSSRTNDLVGAVDSL